MSSLVLLRHGESAWNEEFRFTGWTDVDLTEEGRREASEAGRVLREAGFEFDLALTSVLKRAIRTLWIVLDELDQMWVPVERHWRLNERHYGALQGLNKAETAERLGEGLVHRWRRSYAARPPALERDDERWPGHDRRYGALSPEQVPLTESLQDTVRRVMPYWRERVVPLVREGTCLLIVAHGNSLRAIVKELDGLSDRDVEGLEIPTGVPLVYCFDEEMRAVSREYLGGDHADA